MAHDPTVCHCSMEWRKAKGNGTCATCGGWLPWEKPAPLPWLRSDASDNQQPAGR